MFVGVWHDSEGIYNISTVLNLAIVKDSKNADCDY